MIQQTILCLAAQIHAEGMGTGPCIITQWRVCIENAYKD